MKPIETRAYGYRFRSRLEAKWAVAFTQAQIEWHYEPEGFDLGDAGFWWCHRSATTCRLSAALVMPT